MALVETSAQQVAMVNMALEETRVKMGARIVELLKENHILKKMQKLMNDLANSEFEEMDNDEA